MDKKSTKLVAGVLLQLSGIIEELDFLHKKLTELLIQKGAPNVKNPNNFDHRRN